MSYKECLRQSWMMLNVSFVAFAVAVMIPVVEGRKALRRKFRRG